MAKDMSRLKKRQRRGEFLMALPLILFTVLFIVGPLVYMVALSFMTRAETWGVFPEFTLQNYGEHRAAGVPADLWGVPEAGGHQHRADHRPGLSLRLLHGQAGTQVEEAAPCCC